MDLNDGITEGASPQETRILKIKQELEQSLYSTELIDFHPTSEKEEDAYMLALKGIHFPSLITPKEKRMLINMLRGYASSFLHCYMFTKALSSVLNYQGKFEQAVTVYLHFVNYSYGLKNISSAFISMRDEILLKCISAYNRESTLEQYRSSMSTLMDSTSASSKFRHYKSLMKFEMLPDSAKLEHIDILDTALVLADTPIQKHISYFFLGLYTPFLKDTLHEKYDSKEALGHQYYRKAIEELGKESCSVRRFYPALYGLSDNLDKEDSIYYMSVLKGVDNCPSSIQEQMRFVMFNYLEPKLFELSPTRQVDTLISIRRLTERMYPGASTLHLQDYYLKNLSKIFSVYKENKDSLLDFSLLIQETVDTRLKEKYRKNGGVKIVTPRMEKIYEKINEKLLELNNFKTLKPFPNPIYDDLFDVYMRLEKQDDTTPAFQFETSYTDVQNYVYESNTTLVNITKGIQNYNVYTLDGKSIRLQSIPNTWVDSIGNQIRTELKDSRSSIDTSFLQQFRDSLHLNISSQKLVVISDGILSLLPLEYIIGRSIEVYQNIDAYLNQAKKIDIDASNSVAYSFSDELTIHSRNIREVPELEKGYEECKDIATMMGMRMIAGSDFNEYELFESSEVEWAHISSHAYSSQYNRLNNKIICRAINDKISNLYAYELSAKAHIPLVVVLSACESGTGVYSVGAGVESLSRTLLDNGAKTVVKSLWKVNESATKELMVHMYEQLNKGKTLGESLHLAQRFLRTKSDYSHPYYWAGIVIEGNPKVYLKPR